MKMPAVEHLRFCAANDIIDKWLQLSVMNFDGDDINVKTKILERRTLGACLYFPFLLTASNAMIVSESMEPFKTTEINRADIRMSPRELTLDIAAKVFGSRLRRRFTEISNLIDVISDRVTQTKNDVSRMPMPLQNFVRNSPLIDQLAPLINFPTFEVIANPPRMRYGLDSEGEVELRADPSFNAVLKFINAQRSEMHVLGFDEFLNEHPLLT